MRLTLMIGLAFRHRGRFASAVRWLRAAVRLGEWMPFAPCRRAEAHNALGLVYKDLARYDEARAQYETALSLLEQGRASAEDRAGILHNIGGIEHARGRYAEAEPPAREALRLRRQALGDSDPSVAADRVALGAILEATQQYPEAAELYESALRVLLNAFGQMHGDVAAAMNNLGTLCIRTGDFVRARTMLGHALSVRESLLGAYHPDVALTLNNLALLYRLQPTMGAAAPVYERALAIFERTLGPSHPRTLRCRENYCEVFSKNEA